jgi:hypothetical protein
VKSFNATGIKKNGDFIWKDLEECLKIVG